MSWHRSLNCVPGKPQYIGPAIDEGNGSLCNRVLRRTQIIRDLLSQMPPSTGFYHKMHWGIDDMLTFQELGFEVAAQFTYEIAPATEKAIWSGMRDKTRNVIRRAQEKLHVSELADVLEFLSFYDSNLKERNLVNHFDESSLTRICDESLRHSQGRILAARDLQGQMMAAIFYVWDERRAYYLMSSRSQQSGNGAVALLIWEAVKHAASQGLIFDFDAIGQQGSRVFYIGFGGHVATRYIASKFSLRHRATGAICRGFAPRKNF